MVAKRLKRMASNPFYGADTALLEIGIKAKHANGARSGGRGYCSTRNWNQGKASLCPAGSSAGILLYSKLESRQSRASERACPSDDTALLEIGIKAKRAGGRNSIMRRYCSTRNWNQGKAMNDDNEMTSRYCSTRNWNQGKAVADSHHDRGSILLYSKLESRQSSDVSAQLMGRILLYSKLESRQSEVCQLVQRQADTALLEIGIKAKLKAKLLQAAA